jgi:hypothetical protein
MRSCLTKRGEAELEMVVPMVPASCAAIVKLDRDDLVLVAIDGVYYAQHIEI